MKDIVYYTEEGLEKLKNELDFLKTTERANIAKQIAEARDKGDLQKTQNTMRLKKRKVCWKRKSPS